MYRNHYSFSMPKPYTSLNMPKKFPEDIECVIKSTNPEKGSVYISNIEAAQNLNTLKKFGIKSILTCAKGYQLNHPVSIIPDYKYIAVVDHEGCDLTPHFNEAVDFIKEQLQRTNLLVHCIAGVSRSVSMVIAYLIREKNMTYEEGYRLIKSRRKIICPNNGFISQLKKYEQNKRTLTPTKRVDLSPPPTKEEAPKSSTQIKTPTKSTQNEGLRQFKSTQLTPQPSKPKEPKHTYERYQSTQLTSNKQKTNDYSPKPAQNRQYKYGNYYNSTTNYYTPDKIESKDNRREQILRRYNNYANTKSPYIPPRTQYKTTSERFIKIDATPEKQIRREEVKSTTPKNIENTAATKNDSSRKGYFQHMNKELSEKIDEIRKKYDKERQKLYQKYQVPDRNSYTPKKQTEKVNVDLSREYVTLETRKKTSVPERKSFYDYSEQKEDHSFSKNYMTSNTFYQKRSSYQDQSYEDIYMRKKFEGEAERRQKNDESMYSKYDDLRKNVDMNIGYNSYNRFDDYRGRNYNDYHSKMPSYYGYRRY